MNTAIIDLRKKIDSLDAQIAALLSERMECADTMAMLKNAAGLAVHDPMREAEIINRLQGLHPSASDEIAEIYGAILATSKKRMGAKEE